MKRTRSIEGEKKENPLQRLLEARRKYNNPNHLLSIDPSSSNNINDDDEEEERVVSGESSKVDQNINPQSQPVLKSRKRIQQSLESCEETATTLNPQSSFAFKGLIEEIRNRERSKIKASSSSSKTLASSSKTLNKVYSNRKYSYFLLGSDANKEAGLPKWIRWEFLDTKDLKVTWDGNESGFVISLSSQAVGENGASSFQFTLGRDQATSRSLPHHISICRGNKKISRCHLKIRSSSHLTICPFSNRICEPVAWKIEMLGSNPISINGEKVKQGQVSNYLRDHKDEIRIDDHFGVYRFSQSFKMLGKGKSEHPQAIYEFDNKPLIVKESDEKAEDSNDDDKDDIIVIDDGSEIAIDGSKMTSIQPLPSVAKNESKEIIINKDVKEDKNLIDLLSGILTCCICQHLVEDPIQGDACGHLYCSVCIIPWLFKSTLCPQCQECFSEDSKVSEDRSPAFANLMLANVRPYLGMLDNVEYGERVRQSKLLMDKEKVRLGDYDLESNLPPIDEEWREKHIVWFSNMAKSFTHPRIRFRFMLVAGLLPERVRSWKKAELVNVARNIGIYTPNVEPEDIKESPVDIRLKIGEFVINKKLLYC